MITYSMKTIIFILNQMNLFTWDNDKTHHPYGKYHVNYYGLPNLKEHLIVMKNKMECGKVMSVGHGKNY